MGVRSLEVTYGIVVWGAVIVTGCCATFNVTGTTCELISQKLEHCTALPYTHTGFPNSFGHATQDQALLHLRGAFQTLTAVGCHDNARLFLCAAAFPQCTASGRLLPPCRSLCENAVSGCGFWLNDVNVFDDINCKTMADSSDSKVCVGFKTVQSSVTTVTRNQSSKNVAIIKTSSSRLNSMQDSKIFTSEAMIASPSPRQLAASAFRQAEDHGKRKDNKNGLPQSRTSLKLAKVDFTAGALFKMTDSVDKSVKTGFMLQDPRHGSQSTLPALAVMLSVVSLAGMLTLVIACAFIRKAFRKPFGSHRRKPRDGAFYTNPAFSDLPQITTPTPDMNNVTGQSLRLPQQPYTLDDLPPHPARVQAPSRHPHQQAEANIYQQEPGGFIEQNLFVAPQTPTDCSGVDAYPRQKKPDSVPGSAPRSHAENHKVTSDLVYSNKVTSVATDSNANERSAAGRVESGINGKVDGAPSIKAASFPMVSTNMDDGDMIIANPIAC